MHIVFVCPGMPFRGDFIDRGESLGGSETACYYMAREMSTVGHKVLLFTNHPEAQGSWDGVDYAPMGAPNRSAPLGEYVHSYMESAYTDALIVQRASGVHTVPHAAKTAFWWSHDLALLRTLPAVRSDNYQYDGVLAVSEWHRQQICDTWKFNPDRTYVLPNSVDTSLYETAGRRKLDGDLKLLYQSRPERGIDYLIGSGMIMEQLLTRRPGAHLYVCGYDNTTDQMRAYYEQAWKRIEHLPNCTLLQSMGKRDLAETQRSVDLLVYPGQFEETSCITAMEAQAAGLPMVASRCGAMPETCDERGAKLIPLDDGKCDTQKFVDFIAGIDPKYLSQMSKAQSERGKTLSWRRSAEILDTLVRDTMEHKRVNAFSMARTMLDKSDVRLLEYYVDDMELSSDDRILRISEELNELSDQYEFRDDMEAHYDSDIAVEELDKDSNLDMSRNHRFVEAMAHMLPSKPSNVLDYGCQKGHYIWTMANVCRDAMYTGIEISPRIVEWARRHCRVDGVDIRITQGDVLSEDFDYSSYGKFDGLILGEILEHVRDPVKLMERLAPMLTDGCRVVATTPFGDWEGKDYNDHPHNSRYHLHHFERADLDEMFGHNREYVTSCVPAGRSAREPLGSWVTTFVYDSTVPVAREIDFARKLSTYVARETVTFCALAKNSESTILRSLMSVKDVADEFVIALDKSTSDGTRQVLEVFRDRYCRFRRFEIMDAVSPLDVGFDEARNRTVDAARGDWILWADNDEDLVYPERLVKYVRSNQYDGYGIAQNHMSADPVGVLTTDWPVRLFRKLTYLRFSGVVHEHPDDLNNPNSGPRFPAQVLDTHIMHHGYVTERVRRDRFNRNLPLIKRDRKQNPDRLLGKMLYMRDLSHLCMFEAERNGGIVNGEMRKHAEEGIKLFEELIDISARKPIAARMARDGLEFYSNLVTVLGDGFEAVVQLHASKEFGQTSLQKGPMRAGRFLTRKHFDSYMRLICDEQMDMFETKYW